MLEGLSIPRYAKAILRDNVMGADNQQERPVEEDLRRKSSETICRIPTGTSVGKDIVRTTWRHAEGGRNVHSPRPCQSGQEERPSAAKAESRGGFYGTAKAMPDTNLIDEKWR